MKKNTEMEKTKTYHGEKDVDKLKKRCSELLEYKAQLERGDTPKNITVLLKLTVNTIFGPDDDYTKECYQKLDEIKVVTPGVVTNNNLTGKQSSYFCSKNAFYNNVIDGMIEATQERIAQLSEKPEINTETK